MMNQDNIIAEQPAVIKPDYAKWMLEDSRSRRK